MATSALKRKQSGVWTYFDVDESDNSTAWCIAEKCSSKSRLVPRAVSGSDKKAYSTKGLWSHLKSHHPDEFKKADEVKKGHEDEKRQKLTEKEDNKEIYKLTTSTSVSIPKQLSIQETFELHRKWPQYHQEQQSLTFRLAEWICNAVLPYTVVEDDRFKVMINKLNPKFDIPSEKQLRLNIIPNIYRRVYQHVQILLRDSFKSCSITTDIWSSQSVHSFISTTVHFIDDNWQPKMVVLKCFSFDESHTAQNIAYVLSQIMAEWNLKHKLHAVLRDNGLNMANAMILNKWPSAGCFLHTLQLVVTHSIFEQSGVNLMMIRANKLVSHFKRSPKAMHILSKHQTALEGEDGMQMPHNNLILGEKTRWSSYYDMLVRLEQQKRVIRRCEDDPEMDLKLDQMLTSNDWDLIPKVICLLKPFADVTNDGERERACISEAIPSVKYIIHELGLIDSRGLGTMKTQFLIQMHRYFQGGDCREHFGNIETNELFAIATLLDLRYKSRGFIQRENVTFARELLITKLNTITTIPASQESQVSSEIRAAHSAKRNGWESVLDSSSEDTDEESDEARELEAQVSAYFTEKRIARDDDPLAYWKVRAIQWPQLTQLAKKYLCAPIGSCASEREFKVAKNVSSNERIRLLPQNIERLLFLKFNLRAIGYNTELLKPVSEVDHVITALEDSIENLHSADWTV